MRGASSSNLQVKHIDLILKTIHNSKNIFGMDLDLLVDTIQQLQKLRIEKQNKK